MKKKVQANVSDRIRTWVERMDAPVGYVLHTLDGKRPIRATKTVKGWDFEDEGWVHSD